MRLVMALVMTIGLVPRAHADGKVAARDAYKRASRHFNLAEYAEALVEFKEAYRSYEDPSFLFNIAQCERMLNHKTEAARAYRIYLVNKPDAPNRDAVKQIIADLDVALKEERAAANRPPQDTLGPAAQVEAAPAASGAAPTSASAAPAAALATTPAAPARRAKTPAYKKWWVWTIIAGVAVAGAGVGLGIGLSSSASPASASTTSGTIHPF